MVSSSLQAYEGLETANITTNILEAACEDQSPADTKYKERITFLYHPNLGTTQHTQSKWAKGPKLDQVFSGKSQVHTQVNPAAHGFHSTGGSTERVSYVTEQCHAVKRAWAETENRLGVAKGWGYWG